MKTRTSVIVLALTAWACTSPAPQATPPTTAASAETTTSVAAPATQPTTTGTAPSETVSIIIADFAFGQPIEAHTGDVVVVHNEDGVGHTWTSTDGAFDSGVIGAGEDFSFSFDTPGTYEFFCSIHPSMKGSVTING